LIEVRSGCDGNAPALPEHGNRARRVVDDAFLAALDQAGIHYDNADVAKAMAKSVCPQLVQPGKSFAYVVTEIQGNGVPPGLAAWFAGIAVKMYCPAMMKSVTNGTFFQWIQAPQI
jgi:Protein of unknown function (DUF732)